MGRTFFADIVGNEDLKERLGRAISAKEFPHACILEGAVGTGKRTMATRIAMALSCERRDDPTAALPCMSCRSCRKILSGNSPDLILTGREDKASIGVEPIRAIRESVCVSPNDGDFKVYVVEDAHLLTVQAQNAFLLTLEEPPAYCVFLLLCERATALLETVRSRAPIFRIEPLPRRVVADALTEREESARRLASASPAEFAELLTVADGSLGTAKQLLNDKLRKPILERRESAVRLVGFAKGTADRAEVVKWFGALARKKREELTALCETVDLCLRDLIVARRSENAKLCFFGTREAAYAAAERFTLPELLRLGECAGRLADRLRANANVRLAVIGFAAESGIISFR